jgi:hypothetical protein
MDKIGVDCGEFHSGLCLGVNHMYGEWNSAKYCAALAAVFLAALFIRQPIHADSPEASGDWPGLRGANVDGILQGTTVFAESENVGLRLKWKTRIGGGYASVAIAQGFAVTTFAAGDVDVLAAFDALDGNSTR